MEMINLSVIIPVYNVKKEYLEQCISSVIHQSKSDIEIIIINDGSTEVCKKQCDNFSKLYSMVQVIHQENKGVSYSRNIGVKKARGSWITFVDADDWLEEEAFHKLYVNTIIQDVDIVIGRNYYDWNGNKSPNHYIGKGIEIIEKQKEMLIETLFCGKSIRYSSMAMPWAKLYRTDFLRENNITFPHNIRVGEDGLFNLHAFIKARKIVMMDEFVYVYRQYNQSVSKSYHKDIPQNCRDLFHLYYHSLLEFKVFPKYKKYFSLFIIRYWEMYILNQYLVGRNRYISIRQRIQNVKSIMEPPNDIIYTTISTSLYSKKQRKLLHKILQNQFYVVWLEISFFHVTKKIGKVIKKVSTELRIIK